MIDKMKPDYLVHIVATSREYNLQTRGKWSTACGMDFPKKNPDDPRFLDEGFWVYRAGDRNRVTCKECAPHFDLYLLAQMEL